MTRAPRIAVVVPPASFLGFPTNEAPILVGCFKQGMAKLFEPHLDLLDDFLSKEGRAIDENLGAAYDAEYCREHFWFHVGRIFCEDNSDFILQLALDQDFIESSSAGLLEYEPDIVIVVFQCARSTLKSLKWVESVALNLRGKGYRIAIGIVGSELGTLAAEDFEAIRRVAPSIDFVVPGEADTVVSTIVQDCLHDQMLVGSLVAGLTQLSNRPGDQARVAQLRYPPPDWGQVRFDRYLNSRIGTVAAAISASRGCTYQCTFCDERVKFGSYRGRDTKLLRLEATSLHNDHGVSVLRLTDSLLNPSLDVLKRTAIALGDSGAVWCGMMRLGQSLDEKLMSFLYRMGCRALWFGLESASLATQARLRKAAIPELGRSNFAAAKAAGIDVILLMMTDIPFEGENDVMTTFDYLEDILPLVTGVHFERFRLMQGTTMAKNPYEFGVESSNKRPLETALGYKAAALPTDRCLRELWLDRKGVRQIALPGVGGHTFVTEI